MENSAKQYLIQVSEVEVNVILNGLDHLNKSVGIINPDGSFSTSKGALILNTATNLINQITQAKAKEQDGSNNE